VRGALWLVAGHMMRARESLRLLQFGASVCGSSVAVESRKLQLFFSFSLTFQLWALACCLRAAIWPFGRSFGARESLGESVGETWAQGRLLASVFGTCNKLVHFCARWAE